MDKIIINAQKRTVFGKKVGALRREGMIPGVIYGHKENPISIMMNAREVTRAVQGLTPSSIVTIKIGKESHAALIREKQRNYLRNELIHIDFQVLSLKEKIRSKIEIFMSGVAPAVKAFDGIVLNEKEFIEVEALPTDLPERITIDISVLKEIGDVIRVKDLEISDKVTVFDDLNDVIVSVSGVSVEQETEEEPVESETAEPEVVEKGKKEEEEEE